MSDIIVSIWTREGGGGRRTLELTSNSSLPSPLARASGAQIMIPWKWVIKAEIEEDDTRGWREKMQGMYF